MGKFPTTRWSLVLRSADSDPAIARRAIALICETYRPPILAFLREQTRDATVAEEACQELFADLLARRGFADAREDRGRFRNFLMGAAMHRVFNLRRRSRNEREVPLEVDEGGATAVARAAIDRRTAEHQFSFGWARRVVTVAMDDLESEYAARDQRPYFRKIRAYLAPDGSEPTYAAIGADFGKREGAVKMDVFRLRERFGDALRSRVLQYTADEDAEAEMRWVLATLTTRSSS